jgi:ferredoxin
MWIHVQRLGRPATVAPRALALWVTGVLLGLAVLFPVLSGPRWDPQAVPQSVALDWFLQFVHPFMYATSPAALWALLLGATLLLAALPYLARGPRIIPARVEPQNCNGCGRCLADCPYEALRMAGGKAQVLAERCAGCGICAGACPSSTPFRGKQQLVSGIDLPDFTVHALRARLQRTLALRPGSVTFICESAHRDPADGQIRLRCLAQLPPSFIEFALRNGARRVLARGCGDGDCAWRLGLELSRERFAGRREPRLRATVQASRIGDEYAFALR